MAEDKKRYLFFHSESDCLMEVFGEAAREEVLKSVDGALCSDVTGIQIFEDLYLMEKIGKMLNLPWKASPQSGMPGHCTMAQIFDCEGIALAHIDATGDEKVATARAEFIVKACHRFINIRDKKKPCADIGKCKRQSVCNDGHCLSESQCKAVEL